MIKRILTQIIHDKRTLVLMLVAPLLLLSLIFLILNSSEYCPTVGIVNAPISYVDALYENDVITLNCDEAQAIKLLADEEIIAYVSVENNKLYINIDGTNTTQAQQTIKLLENAFSSSKLNIGMSPNLARPDLATKITYIYGVDDLEMFDNFGAAMIGILIFFFVFLVSGISFLQEKTSGTLEKLLSTPIKRWEIVVGYVLGFGVVTLIQATIITLYAVYALKIMMTGSILLVLLFSLLSAMTALTFGLLASTAAANEFQLIQFIPLVIVPQIFFSGMFTLSGVWEYIGYAMPLYYVADALTEIMIRGNGFAEVIVDFLVLIGFCGGCMIINTKLLKKHREI